MSKLFQKQSLTLPKMLMILPSSSLDTPPRPRQGSYTSKQGLVVGSPLSPLLISKLVHKNKPREKIAKVDGPLIKQLVETLIQAQKPLK